METQNSKLTRGEIIIVIIALLLLSLLTITPVNCQTLHCPARELKTIPDGWYTAEVKRNPPFVSKEIINLRVKVKSGYVVTIAIDQITELDRHSREYMYIGGEITCTYIESRELVKGTAIVKIVQAGKPIIYEITING